MEQPDRCPHCGSQVPERVGVQGRAVEEVDLTLTDYQLRWIRNWATAHLAAIARDLSNGEELGDPVDDMGFRLHCGERDWEFEELVMRQLRDEFKILSESLTLRIKAHG